MNQREEHQRYKHYDAHDLFFDFTFSWMRFSRNRKDVTFFGRDRSSPNLLFKMIFDYLEMNPAPLTIWSPGRKLEVRWSVVGRDGGVDKCEGATEPLWLHRSTGQQADQSQQPLETNEIPREMRSSFDFEIYPIDQSLARVFPSL